MNLDAAKRAELRDRMARLSHVDWAVANLMYALDDLDEWDRWRDELSEALAALVEEDGEGDDA